MIGQRIILYLVATLEDQFSFRSQRFIDDNNALPYSKNALSNVLKSVILEDFSGGPHFPPLLVDSG